MSESQLQQDIYSLLVPLSHNRLLIPRANVAEVTGFRECTALPGKPSWLLGTIEWEKQTVPLVSFEGASGGGVPQTEGRTRIVLLRTLSDALQSKCIGVVTQGFPQLVRVNAMVLEHDDTSSWPDSGPVLCQVKMVNQRPLVPDIEQLEQMIAGALAA